MHDILDHVALPDRTTYINYVPPIFCWRNDISKVVETQKIRDITHVGAVILVGIVHLPSRCRKDVFRSLIP